MAYERYVLVLDDDSGSLEEISLRLLRMGVDAVYAKDRDEASLMARQESGRVGALLIGAATPLDEIPDLVKQVGAPGAMGPRTLVLVGRDPGADTRAQLRELGVRWSLFEPYDDVALRFVVTAALASEHESDPRTALRVPTMLLAVAYKGGQSKTVTIRDLWTSGAYLATPLPFPEGTQLSLEIPLQGETLLAKALVIHSQTTERPERPDIPNGMGVSFSQLSADTEERLRRYLEGQMKTFEI